MSDQEDRVPPAQQPTRRQFIARAFTAAAVLVVPAAITGSAPSVAQAQDKKPDDKYPAPTRTSDLPPASPSASRPLPASSPSSSRIILQPSPSSSPAAPATSRVRSIKDKAAQPVVDDTSKSFDSI